MSDKTFNRMLVILCVLFLWTSAYCMDDFELGLIKPKPEPKPPINLGSMLGSHIDSNMYDVTVHTTVGCGPCARLHKVLDGMPRVRVSYVNGGEEAYPAIKYAGRTWYGFYPEDQLNLIFEQYKPKTVGISVGQINYKTEVASLFRKIRSDGKSNVVDLGGATLTVPLETQFKWRHENSTSTLTFVGAKPRVSKMLIWADVDALVITPDKATLRLSGFPDLSADLIP